MQFIRLVILRTFQQLVHRLNPGFVTLTYLCLHLGRLLQLTEWTFVNQP